MMRKTAAVTIVLIIAFVTGGFSIAAEGAPDRGPRQGGFNREAMMTRMYDMLKERLGSTDEEWTVLKPRLEKVMTLSREQNGGGRMMFGRRRRPEAAAEGQDVSEVRKAGEALGKVLEKEDASTTEIKEAVTKLREAREKASRDLAKAREELRELLTQKQEATLVLMGTLD